MKVEKPGYIILPEEKCSDAIIYLDDVFFFFFIIQIVAEKQKFRKTPFNYAQKKNNLIRSKVFTNKTVI